MSGSTPAIFFVPCAADHGRVSAIFLWQRDYYYSLEQDLNLHYSEVNLVRQGSGFRALSIEIVVNLEIASLDGITRSEHGKFDCITVNFEKIQHSIYPNPEIINMV